MNDKYTVKHSESQNVFVLKFVRWVMVAARNFQGNKTINKKSKDLRQMIYLSISIPIEYCLEYDDWFLFLQNN